MRLVKANNAGRRAVARQDVFEQLREVGSRLEFLSTRYSRLVMDITSGRPVPDMRDSVESMNSQLGYVAKRLQELLLGQHEERHDESDGTAYGEAVAAR